MAEAHGNGGLQEEGPSLLAEALTAVEKTDERFYEAELHRLKEINRLWGFGGVSLPLEWP